MNRFVSYYLFIVPSTLARGECLFAHLPRYRSRQHATKMEMEEYQAKKLTRVLHLAQQRSPFYKDRLAEVVDSAETPISPEAWAGIPFLTKSDLAGRADEISTGAPAFAYSKTTGGSTGQPVTVAKNADALARERAATARAYEWAGVRLGDPQVKFWGVPVQGRDRLLSRVVDFVANRKRVSAFGFDDDRMEDCWRTICSFQPVFLYGYASMLDQLSTFLSERSLLLPESVKAAISTSEVLTDAMRETITRGFGVPVFNEYGCGEVGSIAHECEHGSMHVMADNLLVEIIDSEGRPAKTGEIVVTDLHNRATPLIRYRLGDYGSVGSEPCVCGRSLPVLEGIHGRAYDIVRTSEGKQFHPEAIMYVFESMKDQGAEIHQFQVIQDKIDHLRILLVSARTEIDVELEREIVRQTRRALNSELEIDFEYVERIDREASGKIRLVKSLLGPISN